MNAAATNNDAVNQGFALDGPIVDLEAIAHYTEDQGLALIIYQVATETSALQAALLGGDAHPATTGLDNKMSQMRTLCI